MQATPRNRPRGFTLVELLVVVAIIALISAVALPMVLPALNERRVSEAARFLQATLAGTRDAAIRANAPRGIRLLTDPVLVGNTATNPPVNILLASNRIIPIEPGPDYTEGLVIAVPATSTVPYYANIYLNYNNISATQVAKYLILAESDFSVSGAPPINIPNNPTNWFNNIRQGDKIRFNDSGPYYTIAGPVDGIVAANNPERFISGKISSPGVPLASQANWKPEYLFLMNGQDDNGNGWIDESCDGIDNDGDGIIDPGFNGIDDDMVNGIDDPQELLLFRNPNGSFSYPGLEFEQEVFIGSQASSPPNNEPYTIFRRPVVSPGAREVTLPAGVVIDLTTWNASSFGFLPERSRLPVDPITYYVDIMIDQSGRVITPGAGMSGGNTYSNSPLSSTPFYHFWLTEREGVTPFVIPGPTTKAPLLPIPPALTGERRLVTLFVKTGQIVSNSIQNFNVNDTNAPFYDAQSGIKEPQ